MCIRIPKSDRIVRYRVPHVPREIPIAAGLKELVFARHELKGRAGAGFGATWGIGGWLRSLVPWDSGWQRLFGNLGAVNGKPLTLFRFCYITAPFTAQRPRNLATP